MAQESFYSVVSLAIKDMAEHGYDSQERLDEWMRRISLSAQQTLVPLSTMQDALKTALTQAYTRAVKQQPPPTAGIKGRFTLAHVHPKLRAELDRRIAASAQLIKLNRAQSIDRTLQRFSGWATSIPVGGTEQADKREESVRIRKAITQLPFEERRVAIDQGHKLSASINATIAEGNGAIAAIWHSHWRESGYDYRPAHKARDTHIYLIKDSWAHQQGLIKKGPDGYTSDITQPAEEPFCRCFWQYIYSLQKLYAVAPELFTQKGIAMMQKRA
jgi:hypothetical protein